MNKKLLIIFLFVLFVCPFTIHAATYTREQLEDYIVSTTLSYFYNHEYTDYEGFWEEDSHSTYSVEYTVTPEMLGRSKTMNTQCDAFAVTVYMQTLGYDFSSYYADSTKGLYTSFVDEAGTRHYAQDSADNMKLLTQYYSKVHSVNFMNRIARLHSSEPMVIKTYQKGELSTFSSMTTYTKTLTEMTDSEINGIINEMKSVLRPGDIIVNNGHAMVYVGNALESTGGIIHSSGASFKIKDDGTYKSGDDAFSVRYSGTNYLFEHQVKLHNDKENDIITILRPLNNICNGDTCEINTVSSNAKARSNFKNLRVEQYIYNETDGVTMNVDTSTVGLHDSFSYRLNLTNASHTHFCTSNDYSTEEKCTSNGFEWKATENEGNYQGITITATIPLGLTIKECSNNCTISGKTVTWENVNIAAGSDTSQFKIVVNSWQEHNVVNFSGMKVTYQGETLQMSPITTTITRSVVGEYRKQMKKIVDQDLANENLASFDSPQAYVADFYKRYYAKNSSVGNAFASILDGNKIAHAVFSSHTTGDDLFYERRSPDDYSSLDATEKNISKMVVENIFGGKKYEQIYHPNQLDYYGYRVKPIWSTAKNFNYGDIIVTLKENSDHTFSITNALIYTGYKSSVPTYLYYQDHQLIQHRILNEDTDSSMYSNKYLLIQLHTADLYVVLRPSQVYQPTITTKVILNRGDDEWTAETCKAPYTFKESTKECSTTIEYQSTFGELPTPEKEGYTFEGWFYTYTSSGFSITTEAIPGLIIEEPSTFELVAHWKKNEEGTTPEDPTNPHTASVPDTSAHKSLLISIIGMILMAIGSTFIFKVLVHES